MQLQLRELSSVKSVPCMFMPVVFPKTSYGNVDKILYYLAQQPVSCVKSCCKMQ